MRERLALNRTLKLACSMDLTAVHLVLGNSSCGYCMPIISYQDKEKEMIIDYTNNLVMEMESYYSIFQFQELTRLTKLDIYNIYVILERLGFPPLIYEFLLFTKEIFHELAKTKEFSFLEKIYDEVGKNHYWYSIMGDYSDSVFYLLEDLSGAAYEKTRGELKSPNVVMEHIEYDVDCQKYVFRASDFGDISFCLLSDVICTPEIRAELLSDGRYRKCHPNALKVAFSLKNVGEESVYIVGGQVKCNEIDYNFHSWVEIDSKNIVIDYNHNFIMNRDQYYQLYGAKCLQKTNVEDMEDVINILSSAKLSLYPLYLNYFGVDIARCLHKNDKIFQKMI